MVKKIMEDLLQELTRIIVVVVVVVVSGNMFVWLS